MAVAAANFACLLMLILHVLVDYCNAGPDEFDDLAKNYIQYGLDSEKICHPLRTKADGVTELRKVKNSALIVKPSHVFDSWQMKYNKHCKFKIKGPKGDNLFAVVQRMSLRRNGTGCLDYVTFQSEENNSEPTKYCGKVVIHNGVKSYISGLDDREQKNSVEEFSKSGKITTEIFVSKQPLKTGESLDIVITYTPYQDCSKVENKTAVWSDPENPHICINKKFFCDGYTNCASLLCNDESNCTTIERKIVSSEIGTKVTISAVTTMLLCFVIFVMCFWICKKNAIFCWSQDCAGPSATSRHASSIGMEQGERGATSPPYVPTAPMLEVAVSTSANDKDLPPSYDSLFPPHTNAADA
ncbi:uncharacterized protein LOC106639906 [Copidosoma floridanum]|uniref:uncharacterized protein LOC106639906 n=1 Tax=Copidosoma floridanum TaxID=29053 RepID=UPI0006C9DCB8|nr:uncharacterized protein LOC106639906 [Copidosoma floridanum]